MWPFHWCTSTEPFSNDNLCCSIASPSKYIFIDVSELGDEALDGPAESRSLLQYRSFNNLELNMILCLGKKEKIIIETSKQGDEIETQEGKGQKGIRWGWDGLLKNEIPRKVGNWPWFADGRAADETEIVERWEDDAESVRVQRLTRSATSSWRAPRRHLYLSAAPVLAVARYLTCSSFVRRI